MSGSLDPASEERDFLLASLDDLEAEFAAGDISEADYTELKDDYTVRTADLIRKIELSSPGATKPKAQPRSKRSRTLLWACALAVFSVGAGWLLAQAAGERGASDSLTGEIPESAREKVVTCQSLMQTGELRESLVCFDEILDEDPQNVEALTYRGWFLILAAGTAQQNGDDESYQELVARGEDSLAKAVAVDPGFSDARAFRIVVFSNTDRTEEACAELVTLNSLDPAPMITQLVAPVAERLACS